VTPEAKVLKKLTDYLKKLKAAGEPVWHTKNHGSQYAKAGVPDLAIVYRGRAVWVEVKAPGGQPSEIQKHQMGLLDKAGAIVGVVRTVEELQELLARVE